MVYSYKRSVSGLLCFELCKKTFSCCNGGLCQILQHSDGAKHKLKCGVNTDPSQSKFSWKKANIPCLESNKQNTNSSIDVNKSARLNVMPVSKLDTQTKSEVLWAIKVACSNYSYASCDDIGQLFKEMFPDSQIAQNFSLGSKKTSYIIAYGLRPYLLKLLVKSIESSFFTLQFDKTTTTQVRKQMDLLVRYWCSKTRRVEVRFVRAMMFGHSLAKDVTSCLMNTITDLKMDVSQLLSISSDGPNVNKSIKQKINQVLNNAGAKSLVDIGFCAVHVVHNSFRKGLVSFGIDAEEFCVDIFYYFKISPARREDFGRIQANLGLEENFFLRHVQCRWLTLLPAVDRIISQLDALKAFFGSGNFSCESSGRCQRICKSLNKNNIVHLEVQLLFLQSVKPLFDTFLTAFQGEGPLVHSLYASLVELVKLLLMRFMKADAVQGKNGRQLLNIDIKNVENYLPLNSVEVGALLQKKLKTINADAAKKYLLSARSFYISVAEYLLKKLPFDNCLLEALSCLHPSTRMKASGLRRIAIVAGKMPCIDTKDVSAVTDEWRLYMLENIPESWYKSGSGNFNRVDDYWANVLDIKNSFNSPKYPLLSPVVKCALTLSHSNADAERSLSVNKRMLTSERHALSEDTINGIRLTKDALHFAGGQPHFIEFTKDLLSSCRSAYAAYTAKLEDENKKAKLLQQKDNEAELEAESKKKRLEKDNYLKNLQQKEAELRKEEKDIGTEMDAAAAVLNESQTRLTTSIKNKNFAEASVAMELLNVAKRKCEATQNALKDVSLKKQKIIQSYKKVTKNADK